MNYAKIFSKQSFKQGETIEFDITDLAKVLQRSVYWMKITQKNPLDLS